MLDRYQEALAKVLAKLRASDRFESDVRAMLAEYDDDTVSRVLDFLKANGLVNDRRTAEEFVASRTGRRLLGVNRLRESLEMRGAGEAAITAALPETSVAEIVALLKSQFRTPADRARMARFLYSRGFEESEIESALDRFGSASEEHRSVATQ